MQKVTGGGDPNESRHLQKSRAETYGTGITRYVESATARDPRDADAHRSANLATS
jgi:hypothetical protein